MKQLNYNNTIIIIVSYNPAETLISTLDIYIHLCDKIIIVDNGSSLNRYVLKSIEYKYPQCLILYSIHNKGIAWGMNAGIRKALSYSPEWIITFDQDSIPASNIFDVYNDALLHFPVSDKIGVMSGGFNLNTDQAELPATWSESLVLITSAMAHNAKIFDSVGLYNEDLFIDSVDFEFVMRVRLAGYATIRIQNDVIQHKIGAPLRKQIGPFSIESSNHNEERRYYQSRNLVYITRRFIFKFPKQVINFNYYFFCKILPRMILVERPLWPKMKALLKGFRAGFTLKMLF